MRRNSFNPLFYIRSSCFGPHMIMDFGPKTHEYYNKCIATARDHLCCGAAAAVFYCACWMANGKCLRGLQLELGQHEHTGIIARFGKSSHMHWKGTCGAQSQAKTTENQSKKRHFVARVFPVYACHMCVCACVWVYVGSSFTMPSWNYDNIYLYTWSPSCAHIEHKEFFFSSAGCSNVYTTGAHRWFYFAHTMWKKAKKIFECDIVFYNKTSASFSSHNKVHYLLLIFIPPSTGFGGCLLPSANEVVLGRPPLISWPSQHLTQ